MRRLNHIAAIAYKFLLLCTTISGELTLTSSGGATLCPEDHLHLTCNSSSFLILWTVYDAKNDMNYSRYTEASPSTGIRRPSPLQVASFTFNIATQVVNNTASSDHSLISSITAKSVNIALNATAIICTEVETGIQDIVKINVIDTNECNSIKYYVVTDVTRALQSTYPVCSM